MLPTAAGKAAWEAVGKQVSGKNCLLLLFGIAVGSICDIFWKLCVQIKHSRVNLIQTNKSTCMAVILLINNTTQMIFFWFTISCLA